jgi:hypothetical protein
VFGAHFEVAEAQSNSPGSTFKRVRVGDQPSGSLINIQIEDVFPQTESAPEVVEDKVEITKPKSDLQDWFWDAVSPKLKDADRGRMDLAVAQISKAPSYFRPDIAHMRKIAGLYGRDILLASLGTDVSPAFLLAIISVESAGKVDAVSSAGAQGLMQLIPDTAKRFGVTDVNDPVQNIKGGATYIAWLLNNFSNDPLLALAGYNAGENAVKNNDGIPPYPETRAYVPKVVAAWQVAQSLCLSPPRYVWEGCVFTVPHIPKPVVTTEKSE